MRVLAVKAGKHFLISCLYLVSLYCCTKSFTPLNSLLKVSVDNMCGHQAVVTVWNLGLLSTSKCSFRLFKQTFLKTPSQENSRYVVSMSTCITESLENNYSILSSNKCQLTDLLVFSMFSTSSFNSISLVHSHLTVFIKGTKYPIFFLVV